MKTLLYTGYDEAYEKLAEITVPRMSQYAYDHGYDSKFYTEPIRDIPNGIYWTGVFGAMEAFKDGYERAIYLDADQLITNNAHKLPEWTFGFHASKDWGNDAVEPWQFSACGMVFHHDCAAFLRMVIQLEPEFRDKPFPEQGPMQHIVKGTVDETTIEMNKEGFVGAFNIHPRKVFNCVPDQVCPGAVPEPWKPGDFAAHLTMRSMEDRIRIAKEILSKL